MAEYGAAAAVETAGSTANHCVPAGCVASPAACIIATGASIANSTAISNPAAIAYAAISTTTVAVPAATVAIPATSPITAIPGTRANKDAAYEPARPVITVGGATIRSIRIVAPRTNRRAVPITVIAISVAAANSDTDADLGVRRRSRHQR